MGLVNPHGRGRRLTSCLLTGEALAEERRRAGTFKQIRMSSRETSGWARTFVLPALSQKGRVVSATAHSRHAQCGAS